MYQLVYSQEYIKKEIKFLKKHKDLFEQYSKTLKLLKKRPFLSIFKIT